MVWWRGVLCCVVLCCVVLCCVVLRCVSLRYSFVYVVVWCLFDGVFMFVVVFTLRSCVIEPLVHRRLLLETYQFTLDRCKG